MTGYPLASPAAYGFASVQWAPDTNTARGKNPQTKQDAVQVYDGACWVGSLTIVGQNEAEGRALAAWLTSLEGGRGTFLLGEPGCELPLGSARTTPGTPVVDGAGQLGRAIALRDLPSSAAGYMLAGDYLQLGTGASARLHMLTADLDTDVLGRGTAQLWPAVRSSLADGAAVVVSNAEGLFALTSSAPPWNKRPGLIYDGVTLSIAAVVT